MISAIKRFIARYWPVLRLRTVIFGTLLLVAALPGVGAIFLRVYENALVRRTEAELVSQSAALAASTAILWEMQSQKRGSDSKSASSPVLSSVSPPISPTAWPAAIPDEAPQIDVLYSDRITEIDLSTSPILSSRPEPIVSQSAAVPQAAMIAGLMEPAFQETKLTTLSSIIMLDRRGTILTGPDKGLSFASLPEIRAALAGESSTVLRLNAGYQSAYALEWLSRAANIRLHHVRPLRINGEVVGALLVSRSPRALFRGIYEDRGKIALGVIVIFLMLILLSGLLSRTIVRPIESLSRATRELANGRRAAPGRPSLELVEIRNLFEDFERMAERLDKRSRYLRDFAASVSHEFKTPLAGIGGAVELLQDHGDDMGGADRARFLGNIASGAERLDSLVRRLMEQAQADVMTASPEVSCDPDPVLYAIADAFSTDKFAVDVSVPDRPIALAMDGRVLESVLTSFAENAFQAGAANFDICLKLDGDGARIDLIDNGPGIPEGDRARVFDPFFTSKRAEGGTGLGLSIARSLIENCGGTLALVSMEKHAHFVMICPIAVGGD